MQRASPDFISLNAVFCRLVNGQLTGQVMSRQKISLAFFKLVLENSQFSIAYPHRSALSPSILTENHEETLIQF